MQMPRIPSVPRHAWSDHPHWPRQTLLLGSHANFRRISTQLVDHARRGEQLSWIASVYPQWIAAMRSHEGYEEYKLYPYLERRWGMSLTSAERGHQRLHACDEAVRSALATLRREGVSITLHAALQEHDRVLREHLDHEEELVIPGLLELTPPEFDDYCALRLPELMRRLDEAERP